MTEPSATQDESRVAALSFGPQDTISELCDALNALAGEGVAYAVTLAIQNGAIPECDPDDLRRLELSALPVIAHFETALDGGSAAVALACDIRICGEGASLAAPAESHDRLRRLVRDEAALGRLMQGEALVAEELLAYGLVSSISPGGEAQAQASRLAATIARRGPIAVRLGKEAIWRGLEMPLEQALRFETDLTLLLQTTKDRAEGVRAFLEKRGPRFIGD